MNSIIRIKFNSIPAVDTVFSFSDSLSGVTLSETFKVLRSIGGEATIHDTELVTNASNYSNAISLDYNWTSLYNVGVFLDTDGFYVVTILANNVNSQFTLVSNTTAGALTYEIENSVLNNFEIDTVTISEADSTPCDNVKITVATIDQADAITLPISQAVTTNPFVFEVLRSASITKIRMNKGSVVDEKSIIVPKLLSGDFLVDIYNTPTTGNMQVFRVASQGLLVFEYSINNVDWQSNTNFTNLSVGNYTLYIRDNIGCSITIPFEITGFEPSIIDYDAIAEVSNLNPIRFKDNVDWANCGTVKNVDNTLSYEENSFINQRNFVQKFQLCDTVNTQVKTNYENVTAKLIDCNDNETELTVEQRTTNLNQTDVRDAVMINITGSENYNFYVGLKYGSGNTYDPITLAQNGTYISDLPNFIDAGEYISISTFGWFQILDVIRLNGESVLVLSELSNNVNFNFLGESVIVSSTYNILDYERHEFAIDFSGFDEGYYKVQIDLQDDNFGTKQFLSEWIDLKEVHNNCHVITYQNSENNEINFNTGFTGILRIPYVNQLKYSPNEEQDIYVTDNNTILLDTKIRDFYSFSLKQLPTKMAQKITLVTSMDRLFIDGLSYIKVGELEVTPIGSTNEYLVKGNLVRANYVFNATEFVTNSEQITNSGTPLSISSDAHGLLYID